MSSIAAGAVLATVLPPLALVGSALFIGLLMPRLTDRPSVAAALVGGPSQR
ncbi:MAG TPA: hypothetical protein VIT65_04055 [Microlunatus sp.]